MPTRNGWIALGGALTLVVAGRLFGMVELYVMAAALGLLVVACLVYVRSAGIRLRVVRNVSPVKVHAGDVTRIELAATNRGRGRTPVLHLRDPVGGTRGALLNLAPLRPGATAKATYRLPTAARGVVAIGPMAVEIQDPCGLASRSATAAPLLEVTVFPRVERLAAPGGGGDRNPTGSAMNANALGRQGDEFFAIRGYVVGDDLRRVHWPSTARHGELMIRQDEMPWQDRTTVVLDVRRTAHTHDSFERAMSAAASVATACTRDQHLVRMLSSDGTDSGTSSGVPYLESIMEYLARAEPATQGSLRVALESLNGGPVGGLLVAVLGRASTEDLDVLARLRRTFREVVVVVTLGPLPAPSPIHAALRSVDVTRDGQLKRAWSAGHEMLEVPA